MNAGPVETVEHEEIEITSPIEASNSGADSSADAGHTAVGIVTTIGSRFNGKPREEFAAIMIQTVYRGYQVLFFRAH